MVLKKFGFKPWKDWLTKRLQNVFALLLVVLVSISMHFAEGKSFYNKLQLFSVKKGIVI